LSKKKIDKKTRSKLIVFSTQTSMAHSPLNSQKAKLMNPNKISTSIQFVILVFQQ